MQVKFGVRLRYTGHFLGPVYAIQVKFGSVYALLVIFGVCLRSTGGFFGVFLRSTGNILGPSTLCRSIFGVRLRSTGENLGSIHVKSGFS